MPVNWNLALQQTGREALDYIDAFTMGRKATQEQNAINAQQAGRAKASQQVASGDYAGAQQTAAAAGDFDYAKAIGDLNDDQRKAAGARAEAMGSIAFGLKNLPPEQRAQALQQALPALEGHFPPEEVAKAVQSLAGAGFSDAALDGYIGMAMSAKDAIAQYTKANEQYTLAPGSSRRDAKGNIIAEQPFAPKTLSVSPGEQIIEYQPGGGDQASTGGGSALTLDGVLPHIVAQESGGDFTARNKETGALGAFQVMPATGKAIADRLGVPWRPELMTSGTPDGQAYQQQIGSEAIKEAIAASGGDPFKMAAYYHAGPDQSKWGPKTQEYARSVTARLGGGARVIAQGAPKPDDSYTILTPEEVARIPGLDPNTVYQRSAKGQITAVGGQSRSQLKPWPTAALDARSTNDASLKNIDNVIALLDPKNKSPAAKRAREAIGPSTGLLGDRFTQWHDPDGTEARALIGQIGGVIIKDISGAAVSAAEDARLSRWVPMVTDTPEAALAKLKNLRREIQQRNQTMEATYSEDQGFRPFKREKAKPAMPDDISSLLTKYGKK